MGTEFSSGFAILDRIIDYNTNNLWNYEDENYQYSQKIHYALTGGGYDTPIPKEEIAKWLDNAYLKGKRIKLEVDCEFLSGEELRSYLKTHPLHVFKAGTRAGQRDGWHYHCVIDQNSVYDPEVGF